jgi:hypothetical protein
LRTVISVIAVPQAGQFMIVTPYARVLKGLPG